MHNFCRVVFLILLISSCNVESSKEEKIASFDDSVTLLGEVVSEIELKFKVGLVKLNVQDTFLIIQSDVQPFFRIYSTNNHKLLVEFGMQGNGPQDFAFPVLLKQFDYDLENNSPVFHVFDNNRQLFTRINILEVIESQGKSYEVESLENPKNRFFPYFFYADDDFILGQTEGFTRLLIFDLKKDREIFIPSIPELPFNLSTGLWDMVYRSSAVLNKEEGIIAIAPTTLGQIDYFTTNGEYIKSLVFDDPTRFQEYLSSNGDTGEVPHFYIIYLEARGDVIYGLNGNNSLIGFYEARRSPIKIMAFDWDANPIMEYILDNRLIRSFTFDPIHNRFYTFCPDERDHNIVVYQIPENM